MTTLAEALAAFRRANGLRADETTAATWTCQLGSLALRLPNFAWRRRAITAHDLHHVLTGYPCSIPGEIQMAAWEFASGGMPIAAALFCMPLITAGLVWSPRRLWRAFQRGCRVHNLHGAGAGDALLALPLDVARATLVRDESPWHSHARFAVLLAQAAALTILPLAVTACVAIAAR
jgi:hypothetical protein